ncbi:MAG: long-chain fatty acid--CoA ligase [Blastocatellia bacterium AA13]|nr:MAG: long-chain fatty acid--CoA ligase [Blastocatellia bacterium AA13]
MSEGPIANIRELLESRAARTPTKKFLIAEVGAQSFTYESFDKVVNQAANLLLNAGAKKGDRVGLFLHNRPEYLMFYFACFKIGAWAGPINAHLTFSEIGFVLTDSEPVIVVTETRLLPVLSEAARISPSLSAVIIVDLETGADPKIDVKTLDYRVEAGTQPTRLASIEVLSEDEGVIIYTSGTTGKPKGVLLTHENLLANARQIAEWLKLTGDDRALMIMPLFHVNALMATGMAALWAGGSIVLSERFSASRHWNTIAKYRVTYFGSVATMLSILNHTYPGGVPNGADISGLRFALCGSAPVPVEVMNTYEALFGHPVIEGYGLSESTCRATFNPIEGSRRPGSAGQSIGNEMKIFDENDQQVAPGVVGEIVLRGSNIMKGYYHNEAATREAFRSGWFHTGDLGYCDNYGFYYIVDRKSDMIIRAGENIYPREIDEVLYRHPKIKDAATIGVPDPLYGEEVKSFVVLREGEGASEEEIIEFCKARLASFKCPRSVVFLEDIPKGPTGKLLKRELQARMNTPPENR